MNATIPASYWASSQVTVFESMRVYQGVIFKLEDHLERLAASAQSIGLAGTLNLRVLRKELPETVRRSGRRSAFLRITLGAFGHVTAVLPLHLPEAKMYAEGIRIETVCVRKADLRAVRPEAKSSDYVIGVLATQEAACGKKRFGTPREVILLSAEGFIKEGRTSNLFLVKRGALATPHSAGILDGVTRRTVLQLARRLKIRSVETELTRHDLYTADEVFLTYTSGELVPVCQADGRRIGAGGIGPVTRKLLRAFRREVAAYVCAHSKKKKGRKGS